MTSSNPELESRLIAPFDRCLAMQAEHLTWMKAGCLTKINQWLEERQLMVARLRETLSEIQASGVNEELRTLLLAKLRCIINTEKTLFTLAEQQRTAMSEKLTVFRRSKMTLRRYGATVKNQPPQFVSDQG